MTEKDVQFTIPQLVRLGRMALRLSNQYRECRRKEGIIHHILFGELAAVFGHMTREFVVSIAGRSGRVDFRYGTMNPRVIELVVRDSEHRNQHYGSENRSELRKLSRVPDSKAKGRVLLILDASGEPDPFSENRLAESYGAVRSTPGRFTRRPVSVIYIHPKDDYRFMWHP